MKSSLKSISFKEKLNKFFTFKQKISVDEKIFFAKNLVVMIKAGVPISQAVGVLAQQTKNKRFKSILLKIKENVESGLLFSQALASYPEIFSEIFINMVEAGEKSGQLEKVLEEIANQMKKNRTFSSKLKRALTYPIFVICVMILIGIFSLIFIIPKITSIFSEMEIELPLPTKILIATSNFLTRRGYILLIFIALIIYCFHRIMKTEKGKYFFHSLFLKLPIVGILLKKINLIKFSRNFTSLLASGIPLVQTFEITARVLNNVLYQKVVLSLAKETARGVTISQVLKNYSDLFPLVFTQMIEIGEKTGTLENILDDITHFYEEDIDEMLSNFSSIVEPLLIVIIGIGVAIMALAIITPMYTLAGKI
ncbi:MAG: type II secretion system F family protein [Patescibacteria group bacterium]